MLPQGWDRRTTVLLTFALLFVISTKLAPAQIVDFQNERVPMVEIHDLWRFHTGDDPDGKLGWAKPDFDDSSWKLLRSDQFWDEKGYAGYSGMAWYPFQVVLPANHPPLALYIPEIGTSYQVFAGGRLIGQFGGLPPHERVYFWHPGGSIGQAPALGQTMPIPVAIVEGKRTLVVAIRVWEWPAWASFYDPSFEAFSIGDASLMNGLRLHRRNYEFWFLSAENALLLVYLLAALAGLGLFLLRPGEGEYLWFAAAELLYAAECASNVYPVFRPVWLQGYEALGGLLTLIQAICLSMFFVTFLKQPRGWPFWSAIGSALFGALMFAPIVMEWMSFSTWIPVIYLAWIPFIACQILLLSVAARRGSMDARLLLGPFGLQYGAVLGFGLLFGIQAFGHGGSLIAFWVGNWDHIFKWPFPISVPNIADFLMQISILAILVLRFARTRRDEERFKSEFEAARTVQQVLIPEEIPAIPGLTLECVYKPFSQVGGDFFQIIPVPSPEVPHVALSEGAGAGYPQSGSRPLNPGPNHEGFSPGPPDSQPTSALIVIGDVSGKGMPAAMAVSLLVGAVRTLAHFTQSPGEILTAMNLRMLGRSKDGFTTCLVLRLDPDGTATVANAGHLAPYLGCNELPFEAGLPLGLAAQAEYTESTFRLETGETLTLVTDGIAEARAKTGELFGFERTASIAILSAQHIAATAQAFGQQDDITVLKIHRRPALVTAEALAGALGQGLLEVGGAPS